MCNTRKILLISCLAAVLFIVYINADQQFIQVNLKKNNNINLNKDIKQQGYQKCKNDNDEIMHKEQKVGMATGFLIGCGGGGGIGLATGPFAMILAPAGCLLGGFFSGIAGFEISSRDALSRKNNCLDPNTYSKPVVKSLRALYKSIAQNTTDLFHNNNSNYSSAQNIRNQYFPNNEEKTIV